MWKDNQQAQKLGISKRGLKDNPLGLKDNPLGDKDNPLGNHRYLEQTLEPKKPLFLQ